MYIKVRVSADAKKENFEVVSSDHFNIWVRERAERNMANRRVIELCARYFKTIPSKVRIIAGHRSPSKILDVDIKS